MIDADPADCYTALLLERTRKSVQKMTHYNAIIIGLGAIGSATLYQLSEKQKEAPLKLLGLEQFTPPHSFSSNHSKSRLSRLSSAECEDYHAIVLRSHELWPIIENKAQAKFGRLWQKTGGLILGSAEEKDSFLQQSINSAQKNNLDYKLLNHQEISALYPQFKINEDFIAYYESDMGLLSPEACILSQLELAKMNGAEIHLEEKLLGFEKDHSGKILVYTNQREYSTDKLVLSPGPWMAELLDEKYADFFKVYRQISYRFKVEESEKLNYSYPKFPPTLYISNNNISYVFPDDEGLIKTGNENLSLPINDSTDKLIREVTPEETEAHYKEYVETHFNGISNECVHSEVCLYTCTPDQLFIIDFLPEYDEKVIIASACSGRGFKHSAAIGEALADQLLDNKAFINLIDLFGFKGARRNERC